MRRGLPATGSRVRVREAGISCVVAAPSKIRPAADRVKTDRRDAERLARLLRLGEIAPVRVPGPEEEAARDLVRAREDARGDLMRARHRLSKLLLRHGAVYDATAWTRAHDQWLRRQRFPSGPLAIVFDECYGRMLDAKTRRDALDTAIGELAATPAVRRCRRAARLSARRLHADGVRAHRRARRLAQVPAGVAGAVPRAHPERELKRRAAPARRDHQDRQLTCAPASDRGRLASTPRPRVEASRSNADATASPSAVQAQAERERPPAPRTLAGARGPRQATLDHRRRRRARARRTLLGAGNDGVAAAPNSFGEESAPATTTRGATRENTVSSPNAVTLDARERHRSSSRTPGHAAPTRAYESRHKRRRQPVRSPRRTQPRKQRGAKPLRSSHTALHMSVPE